MSSMIAVSEQFETLSAERKQMGADDYEIARIGGKLSRVRRDDSEDIEASLG
jgi:hypothetical protein